MHAPQGVEDSGDRISGHGGGAEADQSAAMPASFKALGQAGAGLTLVSILKSKMEQGDAGGVRSAVELLCSLARKSPKWRLDITVAGGVPPLLFLLKDPDTEIMEFAAKTLRNMAIDRATLPLLHAAGATGAAIALLGEASSPLSPGRNFFREASSPSPPQVDNDPEVQDPTFGEPSSPGRGFPRAASLQDSDSPGSLTFGAVEDVSSPSSAGGALLRASSTSSSPGLASFGGANSPWGLSPRSPERGLSLKEPSSGPPPRDVQEHAAAILFSLVKEDAVKKDVGAMEGAVPLLASAFCACVPPLPRDSHATTGAAPGTTHSFSFQSPFPRGPPPSGPGGTGDSAEGPSPEMARMLLRVLYYLSVYRPNKARIQSTGIVPVLVRALQVNELLAAASTEASSPGAGNGTAPGGHEGGRGGAWGEGAERGPSVPQSQSQGRGLGAAVDGTTEEAVLLLCSLLCLPQAQRQTVSAGGIPVLCRVLQVGTPTAVECSVAGLVLLAKANSEWCTAIEGEGITTCLTSMGTNPQYSERAQAKVRRTHPGYLHCGVL